MELKFPTLPREEWSDEDQIAAQNFLKVARLFEQERSGDAYPRRVSINGVSWLRVQDNDAVKFVSEAATTFESAYGSQTFQPKTSSVHMDEGKLDLQSPPVAGDPLTKAKTRLSKKDASPRS